ncbi:MAG TPA: twin-arginine translocase subunit TatC, partial [bacterium]|nr:twin-arginine translocase subunit TatC [bacterium]
MASKKSREEIEREIDEEVEDELDDSWDDEGQKSPGAILLRTFGEIRKRFLIIIGSVVFFSCLAGWFCNDIFDFLMRPLCSAFQNRPGGAPAVPGPITANAPVVAGGCAVYPADLLEPTVVLFKMSILIGVLCTLPVIFWQLWSLGARWIPEKFRR